MVKFFNILVFALTCSVTFGQTEDVVLKVRKSNIRFGIGLIHVRMIDEGYTGSRLLFRGTNCLLSLGYGRETNKYIFNFSVHGSFGTVESKSGDLPSNYFYIQPSLELLKNVRTSELSGKENKFFLGALLSSFNQEIENERIIDNISIFSMHGIYLSFFDRLNLTDRHSFQLSYAMPVVVYENRLLWNGGASQFTTGDIENIPRLLTEHGTFSYFNIFNNVQLGLDYVVKTGKATQLKIGYKFLSASSLVESPLHLYSNELIVELKIGL
jgi:hypothetical protein